MSKLPNAPLLEVIFELGWIIDVPKEREKFQFLIGDIYSKLKSKYPQRINLIQTQGISGFEMPIEVISNRPIYRFRKDNTSYPIYQLGPGILSVNTIDEVYEWESFQSEILEIVDTFKSSYEFENNLKLNVALKYIDFYPFDFESNDPLKFLDENLHLKITHNTLDGNRPNNVSFATGCRTKLGGFNYIIAKGGLPSKGEGFIVETHLATQLELTKFESYKSWISEAHAFLSDRFKTMTEGNLYNSFF